MVQANSKEELLDKIKNIDWDSIKPVSYTHLSSYRKQLWKCKMEKTYAGIR